MEELANVPNTEQQEAPAGTLQREASKNFTQDDVNRIVQERLSRAKADQGDKEYSQKLAELQAREMKLTVKEALNEKGLPKELAEIITCKDEADLNNKIDILQKTIKEQSKVVVRKATYSPKSGTDTTFDGVRDVMGLNR